MNRSHSTGIKLIAKFVIVISVLMVRPSWAEPTPTGQLQPAGNGREFLPPAAQSWQYAEDFDRPVNWERKHNLGGEQMMDYGYSDKNHLASAGCAPGEIGGTISGGAISWFADDVANGSKALDAQSPLTASGWCVFTATDGNAALGWFSADIYAASNTTPHHFIGWRQYGESIRAAIGHAGSSFIDGAPIAISNGKPFQWTLTYIPTGGDNGCGQITLSALGSSSTFSLAHAHRDALLRNKFNRFGLVCCNTPRQTGTRAGEASTLWLDNLTYTKLSDFPAPPAQATAHTRTEFFDTAPTNWYGRISGGAEQTGLLNAGYPPNTIVQSYGKWNPTGGRSGGCIGGGFTTCIGQSFYGYDYGDNPRRLSQKLHSVGWFNVPADSESGFSIGWTNKKVMAFREENTLALQFFHNKGSVLHKQFGTRDHVLVGYGAAPGKIPMITLNTWHKYDLAYDPAGNGGLGEMTLIIDDGSPQYFKLNPGEKALDADFDLFGIWNRKKAAEKGQGPLTITAYFDDIVNTVDGVEDPSTAGGKGSFDTAPAGWIAVNANGSWSDPILRPNHILGWARALPAFGPTYTPTDLYSMGGVFYNAETSNRDWNTFPRAYFAGSLPARTQDTAFYATGKIKVDWINTDGPFLLGFFNSANATRYTQESYPDSFIGFDVEKSDGSGIAAQAAYRTVNDTAEHSAPYKESPYLYPGQGWVDFYLSYDPAGNGGAGTITAALGAFGTHAYKQQTFNLDDGARKRGFSVDRFGLLTKQASGSHDGDAVYLDKVTYTIAPN